ncbi:MAG: aminotransferase class I/II-fold pyridoxal phosphate-dependent enzyme [Candidatus Melainabacteria bacterium]|jgi:cystathionine beta-lyase family protein involved in aluminum resistance
MNKPNLNQLEKELSERFNHIDEISYFNHQKVIKAFQKVKVGTEHFQSTTGYGHDDLGRAKLDELYAEIFNTEAALARVNFVSGTHAIACAILGNLKAHDEILFAFGRPYDTLESMLTYIENSLEGKVHIVEHNNWEDYELVIEKTIALINNKTKIIAIQRSRGYSASRPSVSVAQIGQLIQRVKSINPEIICFVDNCYGEFVENYEPTELEGDSKADLIAGSLIKNPGAGIVLAGGYVAGRSDLIENTANRLTCPGVGAEGGPNFGQGLHLFQGIYLAPMIVSQIMKGMTLCAKVFDSLNMQSSPQWSDDRTDIIQRIDLGSRDKLIQFCKLLQGASPVDSHLTPYPAQTPGYEDELIMAAGTFVEGSTSELSADGPLREPYSAYLQGGLSYLYTKIFLERFIQEHF